ncbi:MAG: V-type ATP synthase subunit D [Patescibacteria group bacterium]|nr:V-type ATP synthase subunit D [Patescibacteria group bacterium]
MRLTINPTRMELLRLKKRKELASYGYKLLKEKRDSLMREFLKIIKETRLLTEKIEKEIQLALKSFVFASVETRPEVLEEAFATSSKKIKLTLTTKNIMNVTIPDFQFQEEGDCFCYSLVFSSIELDNFLKIFSALLNDILKLAELENSAHLLSLEIEKTRRRVNALEYVYLPSIVETIKYITRKLDEQERSAIISLMKIKEKIK